jgi:hypothetical protein
MVWKMQSGLNVLERKTGFLLLIIAGLLLAEMCVGPDAAGPVQLYVRLNARVPALLPVMPPAIIIVMRPVLPPVEIPAILPARVVPPRL